MDRSKVIKLVSVTYTVDSIGQRIKTETERTVYCKQDSVTGNEFFTASVSGIRAEYRLTMFEPDYNGEKIVILDGKRYGVYRTFKSRNEMIELYVEEKVGV